MLARKTWYKRKAALIIVTVAFLALGILALADLLAVALLAAIATLVIGPFIAMKTGYIIHSCSFVGTKGFSITQWGWSQAKPKADRNLAI